LQIDELSSDVSYFCYKKTEKGEEKKRQIRQTKNWGMDKRGHLDY